MHHTDLIEGPAGNCIGFGVFGDEATDSTRDFRLLFRLKESNA